MSDHIRRILQPGAERWWDGEEEGKGEVVVHPLSSSLHNRTLVSDSDFIYVSIYLHLIQQTLVSSCPFFFKHIQKYLKIPPSLMFTGSLSNISFP